MKFCDKLAKLRKDNNFSQEQFADKMKVSRQAVSKWESGSSYPDMEKIIQMCSILNCTLEDLMDDGVIGNDSNKNNLRFNINLWANDFLKYITKTYNMFCSMSFKDIIKCLLEMFFIGLILFFIGSIIFYIIDNLIINLFLGIPKVGYFINSVLSNIIMIVLVVIGAIAWLHLFTIRYLDYFITIEDKNVNHKEIEKPIEKSFSNSKQEKIIIRDPKHSGFSFFEGLAKMVVFLFKVCMTFIGCFFIFSFISIAFGDIISIFFIKYGFIFFGVLISGIGLLAINYLILEFIYNFIFDIKHRFKRGFIIFIGSLILIGAGIGLSFICSLDFVYADNNNDLITDIKYIKFNDNTSIDYNDVVIDNDRKDIKIEITYFKDFKNNIKIYNKNNEFYAFYPNSNYSFKFKYFLNDVKNKTIKNYGNLFNIKTTIYISQDNYNRLIENNNY